QDGAQAVRFVIIGDSVAFGQGVGEGETLSQQLQSRLSSKLDSPVEVVNLGVPGYDTCQELWAFKERALPLHPKAGILVYVDNDTDPPVFQVKGDRVISPDVRTGLYGDFMAALRKHSSAYNLLWTRWQVLKAGTLSVKRYAEVLTRKFSDDNPRWQRSKK